MAETPQPERVEVPGTSTTLPSTLFKPRPVREPVPAPAFAPPPEVEPAPEPTPVLAPEPTPPPGPMVEEPPAPEEPPEAEMPDWLKRYAGQRLGVGPGAAGRYDRFESFATGQELPDLSPAEIIGWERDLPELAEEQGGSFYPREILDPEGQLEFRKAEIFADIKPFVDQPGGKPPELLQHFFDRGTLQGSSMRTTGRAWFEAELAQTRAPSEAPEDRYTRLRSDEETYLTGPWKDLLPDEKTRRYPTLGLFLATAPEDEKQQFLHWYTDSHAYWEARDAAEKAGLDPKEIKRKELTRAGQYIAPDPGAVTAETGQTFELRSYWDIGRELLVWDTARRIEAASDAPSNAGMKAKGAWNRLEEGGFIDFLKSKGISPEDAAEQLRWGYTIPPMRGVRTFTEGVAAGPLEYPLDEIGPKFTDVYGAKTEDVPLGYLPPLLSDYMETRTGQRPEDPEKRVSRKGFSEEIEKADTSAYQGALAWATPLKYQESPEGKRFLATLESRPLSAYGPGLPGADVRDEATRIRLKQVGEPVTKEPGTKQKAYEKGARGFIKSFGDVVAYIGTEAASDFQMWQNQNPDATPAETDAEVEAHRWLLQTEGIPERQADGTTKFLPESNYRNKKKFYADNPAAWAEYVANRARQISDQATITKKAIPIAARAVGIDLKLLQTAIDAWGNVDVTEFITLQTAVFLKDEIEKATSENPSYAVLAWSGSQPFTRIEQFPKEERTRMENAAAERALRKASLFGSIVIQNDGVLVDTDGRKTTMALKELPFYAMIPASALAARQTTTFRQEEGPSEADDPRGMWGRGAHYTVLQDIKQRSALDTFFRMFPTTWFAGMSAHHRAQINLLSDEESAGNLFFRQLRYGDDDPALTLDELQSRVRTSRGVVGEDGVPIFDPEQLAADAVFLTEYVKGLPKAAGYGLGMIAQSLEIMLGSASDITDREKVSLIESIRDGRILAEEGGEIFAELAEALDMDEGESEWMARGGMLLFFVPEFLALDPVAASLVGMRGAMKSAQAVRAYQISVPRMIKKYTKELDVAWAKAAKIDDPVKAQKVMNDAYNKVRRQIQTLRPELGTMATMETAAELSLEGSYIKEIEDLNAVAAQLEAKRKTAAKAAGIHADGPIVLPGMEMSAPIHQDYWVIQRQRRLIADGMEPLEAMRKAQAEVKEIIKKAADDILETTNPGEVYVASPDANTDIYYVRIRSRVEGRAPEAGAFYPWLKVDRTTGRIEMMGDNIATTDQFTVAPKEYINVRKGNAAITFEGVGDPLTGAEIEQLFGAHKANDVLFGRGVAGEFVAGREQPLVKWHVGGKTYSPRAAPPQTAGAYGMAIETAGGDVGKFPAAVDPDWWKPATAGEAADAARAYREIELEVYKAHHNSAARSALRMDMLADDFMAGEYALYLQRQKVEKELQKLKDYKQGLLERGVQLDKDNAVIILEIAEAKQGLATARKGKKGIVSARRQYVIELLIRLKKTAKKTGKKPPTLPYKEGHPVPSKGVPSSSRAKLNRFRVAIDKADAEVQKCLTALDDLTGHSGRAVPYIKERAAIQEDLLRFIKRVKEKERLLFGTDEALRRGQKRGIPDHPWDKDAAVSDPKLKAIMEELRKLNKEDVEVGVRIATDRTGKPIAAAPKATVKERRATELVKAWRARVSELVAQDVQVRGGLRTHPRKKRSLRTILAEEKAQAEGKIPKGEITKRFAEAELGWGLPHQYYKAIPEMRRALLVLSKKTKREVKALLRRRVSSAKKVSAVTEEFEAGKIIEAQRAEWAALRAAEESRVFSNVLKRIGQSYERGTELEKQIPILSKQFQNILKESTISEPPSISRFESALYSLRGEKILVDGHYQIDGRKLLQLLEDSWGKETLDRIMEEITIMGGTRGGAAGDLLRDIRAAVRKAKPGEEVIVPVGKKEAVWDPVKMADDPVGVAAGEYNQIFERKLAEAIEESKQVAPGAEGWKDFWRWRDANEDQILAWDDAIWDELRVRNRKIIGAKLYDLRAEVDNLGDVLIGPGAEYEVKTWFSRVETAFDRAQDYTKPSPKPAAPSPVDPMEPLLFRERPVDPYLSLSYSEVELLQGIHGQLLKQWKISHKEARAIGLVEAFRNARRDIQESGTQLAKFETGVIGEKAIARHIQRTLKRYGGSPLSLQLGDVAPEVEGVLRAAGEMTDLAANETYRIAREAEEMALRDILTLRQERQFLERGTIRAGAKPSYSTQLGDRPPTARISAALSEESKKELLEKLDRAKTLSEKQETANLIIQLLSDPLKEEMRAQVFIYVRDALLKYANSAAPIDLSVKMPVIPGLIRPELLKSTMFNTLGDGLTPFEECVWYIRHNPDLFPGMTITENGIPKRLDGREALQYRFDGQLRKADQYIDEAWEAREAEIFRIAGEPGLKPGTLGWHEPPKFRPGIEAPPKLRVKSVDDVSIDKTIQILAPEAKSAEELKLALRKRLKEVGRNPSTTPISGVDEYGKNILTGLARAFLPHGPKLEGIWKAHSSQLERIAYELLTEPGMTPAKFAQAMERGLNTGIFREASGTLKGLKIVYATGARTRGKPHALTTSQSVRSYAFFTDIITHGAVLNRANKNMAKAIGGFLTPDEVQAANKILTTNAEGWGRMDPGDIEKGINAVLNPIGRPFTQRSYETIGLAADQSIKKMTRFAYLIKTGEDMAGRSYYMSKGLADALAENLGHVIKELEAYGTVGPAHLGGGPASIGKQLRLWRSSVVTGAIVPRVGYFTNNFAGDVSQVWTEMGLAQSARTSLQFVDSVPSWSKAAYKFRKWRRNILKERFGVSPEEVLPDIGNALFNKTANRIFAGEEFWIRTKSGELISSRTILKDAIDAGVLDTYANVELKGALLKIGTESKWDDFKALDGWREDISEMASYVQQRQRFNLYSDLRRQGMTSAEAARLTLNALYDWKNGISRAEAQWISSWVPFHRFWRLAIAQQARKLSEPLVKSTFGEGGQIYKMFGQTATARARQQYIALNQLSSLIDPITLGEYQDVDDQMTALVKAGIFGGGWLGIARGVTGVQKVSQGRTEYEMDSRGTKRPITHTYSTTGPFTAIETAELAASYFNLFTAASIRMFGSEKLNDRLNPTWPKLWYKKPIELIGPLHKQVFKAVLSEWDLGQDAGYNPKNLRLRPLEKWMIENGIGLGAFITEDDLKIGEDGSDFAPAYQIFMWRFLGHTALTGFMGEVLDLGEKVLNPEMREFLESPDAESFAEGLGYFLGQHTNIAQHYPASAPPLEIGTGEKIMGVPLDVRPGAVRWAEVSQQVLTEILDKEIRAELGVPLREIQEAEEEAGLKIGEKIRERNE